MSPEKIKLLKELQELENKWSAGLLTNGNCTVDMLKLKEILDQKEMRSNIKMYKKL